MAASMPPRPFRFVELLERRALFAANVVGDTLTVTGTDGDDVIALTLAGNDLTVNDNGFDTVFDIAILNHIEILARAGNDSIDVGPGIFGIYAHGGRGDDAIRGGIDGDDTLLGSIGQDSISGRGGDDVINGGNARDTLRGNSGNDTVSGSAGNDRIFGGSGADKLYGNGNKDRIFGGNGHDTLLGGSDNDSLHGNAGHDTLRGGLDPDRLYALDGVRDKLDGGSSVGGFDVVQGHDEDIDILRDVERMIDL